MSGAMIGELAGLVGQARAAYQDDTAAQDLLDQLEQRLHEPLRLAVAGMVKAGKSTLLNAMIGERVAPTDAGECTRTVTWYRYARTPSIRLRLRDGDIERLPVKRSDGRLVIDLGERSADDVEWIDINWPSESLRSTVLIDTPGMASLSTAVSARTTQFLTPDNSSTAADAIIYLLRHIHASDLKFLEAFRDTVAGATQTVNAVAILSRADEIGSGRIDSLLSASKIAGRYRKDGELRALALGVIPVAGLLAESARTLREEEFVALRELARLDRKVRDRLLVSVDRFVRATDDTTLTVAQRRALLSRFGIFGVRLGAATLRGGVATSSDLSERMIQQSGLIEVQQFVTEQFRSRAKALKARAVLQELEALLREKPSPAAAKIRGGVERFTTTNHDLRELAVLGELRTSIPDLTLADLEDAERLVGGSGTAPLTRLGLSDDASTAAIQERVTALLAHWHGIAGSPLTARPTIEMCRAVIRSIEGVASQVVLDGFHRSADAHVMSSGSPA